MTRHKNEGRRADALRVSDMEHSAALVDQIRAIGKTRFLSDRILQDAVLRRLEVLGEAAGHVSKATRDSFPAIPWKKMRGFTSLVKHEYWLVDLERVWGAIEEMPALRRELGRIRIKNPVNKD